MTKKRLGFYDSGVGGLTVLSAVLNQDPTYDCVYVGDSGRAPYGNKSVDELRQINHQIVHYLKKEDITGLVMACNTSCASVMPDIQSWMKDVPIFNLIDSAASYFKEQPPSKIAVLATPTTVKLQAYSRAILRKNPSHQVQEIPCPSFVPAIEANQIKKLVYDLQKIVDELAEENIEYVVYGCSHYPYLDPLFETLKAGHLKRIDPAVILAKQIGLPQDTQTKGSIRFRVSGPLHVFQGFLNQNCQTLSAFSPEYLPIKFPQTFAQEYPTNLPA